MVGRIQAVFQVSCVTLATYMSIVFVKKFLENEDVTSITYKKYSQTPKDKYPTFSICFKGTTLYWYRDLAIFKSFSLYSSEFEKMLTGKSAMRYKYNESSGLYTKEQSSWKRGFESMS